MKRSNDWFVERAQTIWAASPGRSITCLAPSGCIELCQFPRFLQSWLETKFTPPPPFSDLASVVLRLMPDQSTSATKLVARIAQIAGRATGGVIEVEPDADPAEVLDGIVRELARRGAYPILVIERFHSFAKLADHATVSLLSQLRSLEHEFAVTTILISTQSCATLRTRLSGEMAFVNSAYGDNHDQAVMSALTLEEFMASAPHLSLSTARRVFNLCAGPDPVYQTFIDESRQGLDGLEDRGWARSRSFIEPFILDLFGRIDETERRLLRSARDSRLDVGQRAYLSSLPHATFLFNLETDAPAHLRGAVAHRAVCSILQLPQPMKANAMRLLICSANPDYDLDLDKEVRAIRQVVDATSFRQTVSVDSLVAVTPDDFLKALGRFRPTALHFSGHGCADGIVMRGEGGDLHLVTGSALAQTLRGRGVDLVVLNSCFSEAQADAMAGGGATVIGTTSKVYDDAAIRFSTAFYRTLLDGETVEMALRDGRDALALYQLEDVYASRGDLTHRQLF